MNKKTLGLILLGVLAIIVIASSILNGNSENNLSNKNNEHEIDTPKIEEEIVIDIEPKSRFPYGEEGLEIEDNIELGFSTTYTRNYFKLSFENTGNNDVSIWITSPSDLKQAYKLEIPAYEYNDVYFGNVRANDYLLDITGDRGGQCKGTVNVEIRNTPFE